MADSNVGKIMRSEAILAVADVLATVRFYREQLGFTDQWLWGDPPNFGGVSWGKASLMFSQMPELAGQLAGHEHYFFVQGIEALHERHRQRGVTIVSPLRDEPWGLREYVVRDPNGYHLRFGEHAARPRGQGDRPPLPANFHLVERIPTVAEYARLIDAVGWSRFVNPNVMAETLQNSRHCVLALVDQEVVGMARVVGDEFSWLYVQDVIVVPPYQKMGIGVALMGALMEHVLRILPSRGAVGLFTGRNLASFYERFGFEGPETSLYGMSMKKRDDSPTP